MGHYQLKGIVSLSREGIKDRPGRDAPRWYW